MHPSSQNESSSKTTDYYRRDKGFGLTVQAIVPLTGDSIWDVKILDGHNNDQGVLRITKTVEFLDINNIKLAGDLGYNHPNIITPEPDKPVTWRKN